MAASSGTNIIRDDSGVDERIHTDSPLSMKHWQLSLQMRLYL